MGCRREGRWILPVEQANVRLEDLLYVREFLCLGSHRPQKNH